MGWYRGFFRLWCAVSVLWLLVWSLFIWNSYRQNAEHNARMADLRGRGKKACDAGFNDLAALYPKLGGRSPNSVTRVSLP